MRWNITCPLQVAGFLVFTMVRHTWGSSDITYHHSKDYYVLMRFNVIFEPHSIISIFQLVSPWPSKSLHPNYFCRKYLVLQVSRYNDSLFQIQNYQHVFIPFFLQKSGSFGSHMPVDFDAARWVSLWSFIYSVFLWFVRIQLFWSDYFFNWSIKWKISFCYIISE